MVPLPTRCDTVRLVNSRQPSTIMSHNNSVVLQLAWNSSCQRRMLIIFILSLLKGTFPFSHLLSCTSVEHNDFKSIGTTLHAHLKFQHLPGVAAASLWADPLLASGGKCLAHGLLRSSLAWSFLWCLPAEQCRAADTSHHTMSNILRRYATYESLVVVSGPESARSSLFCEHDSSGEADDEGN